MIERLKTYLFGKKVYFNDEILGNFEARVKSPYSTYVTWQSIIILNGQQKETSFILDGNSKSPEMHGLVAIKNILTDINKIIEKVNHTLQFKSDYHKLSDWKKTFFLSAINPYMDGFEIIFEPYNEESNKMISCIWRNGNIDEIE